jgi:hypothetical protein
VRRLITVVVLISAFLVSQSPAILGCQAVPNEISIHAKSEPSIATAVLPLLSTTLELIHQSDSPHFNARPASVIIETRHVYRI